MAAEEFVLPDARPDDDEDVVWGLSTASALWGRGERRDALVWIRRASEAAEAAGHPFRASELGMYATELEEKLTALAIARGEDLADTATDDSELGLGTGYAPRDDRAARARDRRVPNPNAPDDVTMEMPALAAHYPFPEHGLTDRRVPPPPVPASQVPPDSVTRPGGTPLASSPDGPRSASTSAPSLSAYGRDYHPTDPDLRASNPSQPPPGRGVQGSSPPAAAPQNPAPAGWSAPRPMSQPPPLPASYPAGSASQPPPAAAPPAWQSGHTQPMLAVPQELALDASQFGRSAAPPAPSTLPYAVPRQATAPPGPAVPAQPHPGPALPAHAHPEHALPAHAHPEHALPPHGAPAPAPPPAAAPPAPVQAPPPAVSAPKPPPVQSSPHEPAGPSMFGVAQESSQGNLAAAVVAATSPPAASTPAATGAASAPQPAAMVQQGVASRPVKTRSPRAPILDPWTESPADELSSGPSTRTRARTITSDVVVSTAASSDDDDEDVVTSAMPLEQALGLKSPTQPPPRRPPPAPAKSAAPKPPPPPSRRKETPPRAEPEGGSSPPPVPSAAPAPATPPPSVAEAAASAAPAPAARADLPPTAAKPPSIPPPRRPSTLPPPPAPPLAAAPERRSAPPGPPPADALFAVAAAATAAHASGPPSQRSEAPTMPEVPMKRSSPPPGMRDAPSPAPVPPPPAMPTDTRRAMWSDAPAPSAPPPPPTSSPPTVPPEQRTVAGIRLDKLPLLGDLPADQQVALASRARVEELSGEEEASGFSVALIVSGSVSVCAAINDAMAIRAPTGAIVPDRSSLDADGGSVGDSVRLRVVAQHPGAVVALWDRNTIESALHGCPWVLDELADQGDRLKARAGATMGPLGELDEATRLQVLDLLTVRKVPSGGVFAEKGVGPTGIAVVGVGSLEVGDGVAAELLGPGDLLFAGNALDGRPAPERVVAAQGGALVLVGDRRVAQELFAMLPHLIELFASQ